MSDTVDLTLLSGLVQGLDREMRLLRLQVDNLVPRIGIMEQSFHELVGEVSRGFGQTEQRFTRLEKRMDALDAGLSTLRADLAASTASIIAAIAAK